MLWFIFVTIIDQQLLDSILTGLGYSFLKISTYENVHSNLVLYKVFSFQIGLSGVNVKIK